MREHSELGHRVLEKVPELSAAAQVVLCHEERFDGSGYPGGLRGADIPLAARMFAVIDTLDAITSDRPYRKGASFDAARDEIVAGAGRQFDPRAVEALLAEETAMRRMVAVKCGDPHRALVPAPDDADAMLVDADQRDMAGRA